MVQPHKVGFLVPAKTNSFSFSFLFTKKQSFCSFLGAPKPPPVEAAAPTRDFQKEFRRCFHDEGELGGLTRWVTLIDISLRFCCASKLALLFWHFWASTPSKKCGEYFRDSTTYGFSRKPRSNPCSDCVGLIGSLKPDLFYLFGWLNLISLCHGH